MQPCKPGPRCGAGRKLVDRKREYRLPVPSEIVPVQPADMTGRPVTDRDPALWEMAFGG